MKRSVIFYTLFFALLCSFNLHADELQSDNSPKSTALIPKTYELADEQYKAWQKIQQQWIHTEYRNILAEQKLSMNCNGCENIYMDAVFSIDAQGKLTDYAVVNSKKCADKFSAALATRFTDWFFKLQFPPALYGLKFEVRLGTGLSC